MHIIYLVKLIEIIILLIKLQPQEFLLELLQKTSPSHFADLRTFTGDRVLDEVGQNAALKWLTEQLSTT